MQAATVNVLQAHLAQLALRVIKVLRVIMEMMALLDLWVCLEEMVSRARLD